MSSSSLPVLLGIIALIAGAVWFDAQHGASSSSEARVVSESAELQAAVK